jgi:hypothetical protein
VKIPILACVTIALCLACATANAFLYLTDPNYPPVPDESWWWRPVLTLGVVYVLFALLAWAERDSWLGSFVVLTAVCLAALLLVWGRGMDWYGSRTVPNYYNQVVRLGSGFGGLGQLACLLAAASATFTRWLALRMFDRGGRPG